MSEGMDHNSKLHIPAGNAIYSTHTGRNVLTL